MIILPYAGLKSLFTNTDVIVSVIILLKYVSINLL